MPARLNPAHDQRTRDKIKTSQLINRLQDFALLLPDDEKGWRKKKMTPEQIRAAEKLLAKTLPDLSNVQLSGDPDAPMKMEFSWAQPSKG